MQERVSYYSTTALDLAPTITAPIDILSSPKNSWSGIAGQRDSAPTLSNASGGTAQPGLATEITVQHIFDRQGRIPI